MSEQEQGAFITPTPPNANLAPGNGAVEPASAKPEPQPSAVEPMWQVIKRLPKYARLSTALARDSRVSNTSKGMLVAGGLYLVSPIDLVPGIIPVAGQLDDLYVVLLGLQQAIRTSPDDVIDEHFAAIGLPRTMVDEDLATIRAFVRHGLVWSLRKGGQAMAMLSRQVSAAADRARQWGESLNDQKSL